MNLSQELEIKLAKSSHIGGQCQETIREHTDALLTEAKRLYDLKYINIYLYKKLEYACEKHDYGKINESMQRRMQTKKRYNPDEEVQHNLLSALFVLREDFDNDDAYMTVLYAVLFHHDNHVNNSTLSSMLNISNDMIDTFCMQYKDKGAAHPKGKILRRIDTILKARDCDDISGEEKELYNEMVRLKGLLHKCDYSASAHIQCEYANDFLQKQLSELLLRWQTQSRNKNIDWNPMQMYAMQNRNRNMLIVAPTGKGKTEAGLLWADNEKCFFVLPLKTAINAMYDRLKTDIICNQNVSERLALLHSDMQTYYMNELNNSDEVLTEDSLMEYSLKSRQMALPLTIATLDQIFDFTLKFYGYEYKLSTLSYSKIIIDEIQMYSPELLAYLVYGIKKIVEMGGKVAIMTATLPPYAKTKLLEVMGSDIAVKDFSHLGEKRHHVKVFKRQLNSEDIIDKWHAWRDKKSRKILVICNSIETAQNIYLELKSQLSDELVEILLLHAAFTKEDRTKKERRIKQSGKTYIESGNEEMVHCAHEIWISTSVVEASLDIDFDYLFTELLELFSLFQRMGRINRKGVKSISEPNCFVYTELRDKPLKHYLNKDDKIQFVDKDIYDFSRQAILTVDGILDEMQKTELIQQYLSEECLEQSGYARKYEDTFDELKNLYVNEKTAKDTRLMRNIQNVDIIPYSVYQTNKKIIDAIESDIATGKLCAVDKIRKIETIRQYIISVNMYRIRRAQYEKQIKLSRHLYIPVIHCEYDENVGLQTIHKSEKKSKTTII